MLRGSGSGSGSGSQFVFFARALALDAAMTGHIHRAWRRWRCHFGGLKTLDRFQHHADDGRLQYELR